MLFIVYLTIDGVNRWSLCSFTVTLRFCRYQASGPELITTHRWLFKSSPGGRLLLLSARPVVTFPVEKRHRLLTGTKLYCLVTEAHRCEQLARGRYAASPSENWTQDLTITSPTLYCKANVPPSYINCLSILKSHWVGMLYLKYWCLQGVFLITCSCAASMVSGLLQPETI